MGSGGPAARITDKVVHPLPGNLIPGPGSFNVLIGNLPAWRGLPLAMVAGLQSAKTSSEATIKAAETATSASRGTTAYPAVKAAEVATQFAAAAAMGSMITSLAGGGSDIHLCATLLPAPPHGPGVVIDGSPTVFINNMPACRVGDTLIEAVGPPNKIVMGMNTVLIGNKGPVGSAGTPKMGNPANVAPVRAFKEASISGAALVGPCKVCGKI